MISPPPFWVVQSDGDSVFRTETGASLVDGNRQVNHKFLIPSWSFIRKNMIFQRNDPMRADTIDRVVITVKNLDSIGFVRQ